MSNLFEEREKGYEAKWAHDEEKHFKVMARRNELLGRWAAGELRLRETEANDYATAVIHTGLVNKGADAVFDKIRKDFDAAKIVHSDRVIHHKMEEFFHVASEEVAG